MHNFSGMRSGTKFIFGFIAFALLLIGAYLLYGGYSGEKDSTESLLNYSNASYGISFSYPDAYVLEERQVISDDGKRRHYAIVLVRSADLPAPERGEGPPTITIQVFPDALENVSLEKWLIQTNDSNFNLSDGTYISTTLSDTPALRYHWSGLYEANSAVFAHRGGVIAISGAYLDRNDPIVEDFESVAESLFLY